MVNSVSNSESLNKNYGSYATVGLLAGAGGGAAIGGLSGYITKPWQKGGELTDTFIRQVIEDTNTLSVERTRSELNELKKLAETGDWNALSSSMKNGLELEAKLADVPVKIGSGLVEENKAFAQQNLDNIIGTGTIDDAMEAFSKELRDNLKRTNLGITMDTTEEALIKIVAKEPDLFGVATKAGQTIDDAARVYVSNFGADDLKRWIVNTGENHKATVIDCFDDVSKGVLKELPEGVDDFTRKAYENMQKSMKQMKRNAAGKWALIGAGTLGVIGLIIGASKKKQAPAQNKKGLNATA